MLGVEEAVDGLAGGIALQRCGWVEIRLPGPAAPAGADGERERGGGAARRDVVKDGGGEGSAPASDGHGGAKDDDPHARARPDTPVRASARPGTPARASARPGSPPFVVVTRRSVSVGGCELILAGDVDPRRSSWSVEGGRLRIWLAKTQVGSWDGILQAPPDTHEASPGPGRGGSAPPRPSGDRDPSAAAPPRPGGDRDPSAAATPRRLDPTSPCRDADWELPPWVLAGDSRGARPGAPAIGASSAPSLGVYGAPPPDHLLTIVFPRSLARCLAWLDRAADSTHPAAAGARRVVQAVAEAAAAGGGVAGANDAGPAGAGVAGLATGRPVPHIIAASSRLLRLAAGLAAAQFIGEAEPGGLRRARAAAGDGLAAAVFSCALGLRAAAAAAAAAADSRRGEIGRLVNPRVVVFASGVRCSDARELREVLEGRATPPTARPSSVAPAWPLSPRLAPPAGRSPVVGLINPPSTAPVLEGTIVADALAWARSLDV